MSPLNGPRWFRGPAAATAPSHQTMAAIKLLIGLAVAALFYLLDWHIMAVIVAVIAVLLGTISLASARGGAAIEGTFARLGVWLGRAIAAVTLTPIFFVVFPVVRFADWVGGRDPLRLRKTDSPSFWSPADPDARKVRWAHTSFATETPVGTPRRLRLTVVFLVLVLGVGELVLQSLGFGDPVLYVDDVEIGYLPASNQEVTRRGHRIAINQFGMRAPSVSPRKPEGTFRILMLGDSTLYGGSYIDQSELYARRLQQQLAEIAGERPVEVLNMGVNGWGPFHKLGYLARYGTFEADLTLICLPYGDTRRPLSRLAAVPYLPAHSPPSFAFEEIAHHLAWRWRNEAIGSPSKEERARRSVVGVSAYRRLADTLAEKSEVMIEVLPSWGAATRDTVGATEKSEVARLRAAVRGYPLGFPAGFMRHQSPDAALYHDGVHLDVDGHRIYAGYLVGRVREQSQRWRDFMGGSR